MPESIVSTPGLQSRHRGRFSQVRIYLVKFFRMFIFKSDWKMLPMATVISAVVAMVVQPNMFQTMEGTVFGAFALSCVSIWNGCFNSIQVVCRERGIIKREHRSGMHISSYILAHMIYQAFLCLCQTVLLVIVSYRIGVKFPAEGFITGVFSVDFGISIFLVTYASDMLGLFVSSFVRNTTLAMTIMPFILIFQLVFSGGFFTLPEWSQPLTNITVSQYGLRSIAGLGDYNELPSVTAWSTISGMKGVTIEKPTTVDKVFTALQSEPIRKILRDYKLDASVSLDQVVDRIVESGTLEPYKDKEFNFHLEVGTAIEAVGEDRVQAVVMDQMRAISYKTEYEKAKDNILGCWGMMILFSLGFAALATIALEFIDKDKR